MTDSPGMHPPPQGEMVNCDQCGRHLAPHEERIQAQERNFCRTCYDHLRQDVSAAVTIQGQDINWTMAALGGILGGAVGAAVWWGFTVLTEVAFGLVAIVIGYSVAFGILRLGGGKRSRSLQILSVGLSTLSFFYASYLVGFSFRMKRLGDSEELQSIVPPLLPDPETFYQMVAFDFSIMDAVFLAIVVWQAWSGLAPARLPRMEGSS